MSHSRIAFALLAGLAICCSVMYVTADGADVNDEVVLSVQTGPKSGVDAAGVTNSPSSVSSVDVQKAGNIYTNTPDGRMRLTDYLANVEKEIEAEEAARKRDVLAVQAQMARNFAFNKAARKKLNTALLAKMAQNAKKAKSNLQREMRNVQAKFAAAAKIQNERHNTEDKQHLQMLKTIQRNKAAAEASLGAAVKTQQMAMATLKDKTNARIRSTDKAVAMNSANIVNNAKAAHDALTKMTDDFDQKIAGAAAGAKAGRSKLLKQLKDQDKSLRSYASNKLKVVIASNALKFSSTEKAMAADREAADRKLAQAAGKMQASLNAENALNDDRFKKTVKDIAAAKQEATDRVKKATTDFNAHILELRATVRHQAAMAKARMATLSGVVEKNKLAQAKVDANVKAEMTRMFKVGDDRYKEHLAKDKELAALVDSNKEKTDSRMKQMSAHYTMELDAVRATMTKNRAHATAQLAKKTAGLYDAMAKAEKTQEAINKGLAKDNKNARRDIRESLSAAKTAFTRDLGMVSKTVSDNDKKFDKKMRALTGVVDANRKAAKEDRAAIAAIQLANKADLQGAVNEAIQKGADQMRKAETKLKNQNTKSQAALALKVTQQINDLKDAAHGQIEALHLQSKAAREEMRGELLQAVKDSAADAKKNLDAGVATQVKAFGAANKAEDEAQAKSAKGRAALELEITRQKAAAAQALSDAVGTMEGAMLTLKTNTKKAIKKTNTNVGAYAKQLEQEAKDVRGLMKAQLTSLAGKISAQAAAAAAATTKAAGAAKAESKKVSDEAIAALKVAADASDKKFAGLYETMAKNRQAADDELAASVISMNDDIAKQAALSDARFIKTVKDIKAARAEAAADVSTARKQFATSLLSVTAKIKQQETRIAGETAKQATIVQDEKAAQLAIARKNKAEHKRILTIVNDRQSESKKARGVIRKTLDEYKQAAADETAALDTLFTGKVKTIRSDAATIAKNAKKDLSDATKNMYGKLSAVAITNKAANDASAAAIAKYEADAAEALKATKKRVNTELTQLTNVVASNAKKTKRQMEVLTGVIESNKSADKKDRELISTQIKTIGIDMNKAIVRAISTGEARAKGIAEAATANLKDMNSAMLVEITETVEKTADNLFQTIQGGQQTIADNYLSLKAYAMAGNDKLTTYRANGEGKKLSSLGDVLATVSGLADVKEKATNGIGAGANSVPAIFSGAKVPVKNSVSKINALVNEYTGVTNQVRMRWPLGLGKYLLKKLQEAMMEKGVLQVDKIENKKGNWVFLNGHAVGLSNKLNDFEDLAVAMGTYEKTLAAITAALTAKPVHHNPVTKKIEFAAAPEWKGN